MTLDLANLSAYGITAAQLVTTSEGADTLTLTVAGSVNGSAIIAPFEQVTFTASGGTRFVGWLDQAPRSASGSSQSHSYIINGPMRWLDRVYYTTPLRGGRIQLAPGVAGDSNALGPIDEAIRDILDLVIEQTTGAISYNSADLDIAALQHAIPPETRLDSKCSDLLRRALKYAPTVVYWWEGTTIRFADADKTSADKSLSDSLYSLIQASINPRYDLLHDKVKIFWLQDNSLQRTDVTASTGDAATLGANRTLVQTFEVGRYNVPASSGSPAVAGIAGAILKHCSRLHIDATAEMLGLDWTHRPGHLWSYAGLLSSPYKSAAYQVTRDLMRLTQSLDLGVPPAYGIWRLSDGNNANSPRDEEPTVSGHPLEIVDASTANSIEITYKVRIIYGTVAGLVPSGMSSGDNPPYELAASGDKVVWASVNISSSTGEALSADISQGTSVPADSATTFHQIIGSYSISSGTVSVSPAVSGSLAFTACRDAFSNPPVFTAIWGNL